MNARISPDTIVSTPLKLLVCGVAGFTAWSWALFGMLDRVEDSIRDVQHETELGLNGLRREVSGLRTDVARISSSDITRSEVKNWIDLMKAKNPALEWVDAPRLPR